MQFQFHQFRLQARGGDGASGLQCVEPYRVKSQRMEQRIVAVGLRSIGERLDERVWRELRPRCIAAAQFFQ